MTDEFNSFLQRFGAYGSGPCGSVFAHGFQILAPLREPELAPEGAANNPKGPTSR